MSTRFTAERMSVLRTASQQLDDRARNMITMWNKQRQATIANLQVDWMLASAGLHLDGNGNCFSGAQTIEEALYEVLGKTRFDTALAYNGSYKQIEHHGEHDKPNVDHNPYEPLQVTYIDIGDGKS
jgi:hypothetical protein